MSDMITISNANFSYDDKKILENFSLTVATNERVALFAPSGKGKTTLADIICGLLSLQSGTFSVNPKARIARTFQEPRIIGHLSVLDNIRFISGSSFDKNIALNILNELELSNDASTKALKLSGGMAMRLEIAKALYVVITSPESLLVMDEPFRGLDDKLKEKVICFINKTIDNNNTTLILITHDMNDIDKLKSRTVTL